MRVVRGYPPIFAAIKAAFPSIGPTCCFAWDGVIYAAPAAIVTPAIREHEAVHAAQQAGDPLAWWRRYIADEEFRLAEEVLAHRREYEFLCETTSGRAARRRALSITADKLSAPLYRFNLSKDAARRMILNGRG